MTKEILIHGIIGVNVKAKRVEEELAALGNKPAKVKFSSKGGDPIEAISIFNSFQNHKAGVEGTIEGPCFSAAAIAALGCSKLKMKANTLMMFHNVMAAPKKMLTLTEIDTLGQSLKAHQASLVTTLTAKTGQTDEQISSFLNEERMLRPNDALNLGLVQEVIPVTERMRLQSFFTNSTEAPEHVLEYVNLFNERSQSMALRDVVGKLELDILNLTDETEDSVIETEIINFFEKKNAEISRLQGELDAEKKKVKTPEDKPEPVVTSTMVNMVQDYRETKLDQMVSKGKLTTAAAKLLKAEHCAEQAAKNTFINEDTAAFDAVIATLEANDTVVNLGGSGSGLQYLPKSGSEDEQNFLAGLKSE